MSPSIKIGLVALVGSAAAFPQHNAHSRFHSRAAGGGYGHSTGTGVKPPLPSGTGHYGHHNGTGPYGSGRPSHSKSKTTTIVQTVYQTEYDTSTVHAAKPKSDVESPSAVAAAAASSAYGGAGGCGPATVYVTATDRVTVTVPAGGAGGASSAAYSAPVSSPADTVASSAAYTAPSVPSNGAYSVLSSVAVSSAKASTPAAVSSALGGGYGAPSSVPVSVLKVSKPGFDTSAVPTVPVPYASTPSGLIPTSVPAAASSQAAPSKVASSAAVSSAAASSAAAKPSGGPSYSGGKRGLAYNDASLCSKLGSGFSWAYNWGSVVGGTLPQGVSFVPQMHKPQDQTSQKWLSDAETAIKGGSKLVMGFNECDHKDQCALDATTACGKWKEYMNPIASNHPEVTIIGPSVTNGPAPMGLAWLDDFNTNCKEAVWHATNIHFYDNYDDKVAERFSNHTLTAAKNYGKKVWVTEFGLNPTTNDGKPVTDAQVADFLGKAVKFLDGESSVAGYSYFMVGSGPRELLSGGSLSPAGKVYAGGS